MAVPDLVIGGSGFVGRNLVRRLENTGRDVVVADRVPDSTSTFTGTFIEGDAQDPEFVALVLRDVRPETVYHLAANSDIASGIEDASLDFGDTLMTTVAIRDALIRHPATRLVFASSSAIFGISNSPLSEESSELPNPVSWYGKAKLASEYVLESLAAVRPEMAILVVRFPNVVGPLATHGVVFDFIRKLQRDPSRLDVLGDGNQTKPYVHVSELIDGMSFFLERAAPGISRVNIGPRDLVDVKGIVTEVCSVLEVSPDVFYEDSPVGWIGDVPRYEFDTTKMLNAGFFMKLSSREAVRRAAEDLIEEWTIA